MLKSRRKYLKGAEYTNLVRIMTLFKLPVIIGLLHSDHTVRFTQFSFYALSPWKPSLLNDHMHCAIREELASNFAWDKMASKFCLEKLDTNFSEILECDVVVLYRKLQLKL